MYVGAFEPHKGDLPAPTIPGLFIPLPPAVSIAQVI